MKILAVAGSAFAAILGVFGVSAHRLFHECVHDGSHHHTHELGQLFGLVRHDSDTPIGIYRPSLACLPLLFLLTSRAFDWAVGSVARLEDDYL